MSEILATIVFLFVLFALLGSSVWIGLALMGVAWVGMELFTSRPAGDAMLTCLSGWEKFFIAPVCQKICFEALRLGCEICPVVCCIPTLQAVRSLPRFQVHRQQR